MIPLIPKNLKTSWTKGNTYTDENTNTVHEYESDSSYLTDQIMGNCANQVSIEDLTTKAEICTYMVQTEPINFKPPSKEWLTRSGFKNYTNFLQYIEDHCTIEDNIQALYNRRIKELTSTWMQITQEMEDEVPEYPPINQCSNNLIADYISAMEHELENLEYQGNAETLLEQEETINRMLKKINKITGFRGGRSWVDLQKPIVQEIIDNRLIFEKQKNEVFSFSQSLCHFWFDSFLPKYLESEQILSAFTNYITKFDYYKVLESEFFKDQNEMLNIMSQFTKLIGMDGEGEFYSCHKEYKQCILSDHCQVRTMNLTKNKIEYCSNHLDQEQDSCTQLVKKECEKDFDFAFCPSQKECEQDPDSPLCPSDKEQAKFYQAFKRNCNKEAYGFCQNNSEHPFCLKFSGRCLSNFRSCMKSQNMAEIFNPHNILNPNLNDNNNPLLTACLKDPYQFFTFENKLAIYELSEEDPIYEGGLLRNFSINGNFSFGNTISWSGSHGHSISASGRLDAGAERKKDETVSGLRWPKWLRWLRMRWLRVGGGLQVQLSEAISSDASNASRRSADVRVSNAIFLTIGNVKIRVNVKNFKKCLVVKPSPNAFFKYKKKKNKEPLAFKENQVWATTANQDLRKIFITRPGLILCNPLETNQSEPISEDYYYISQSTDSSTVKFLNMSDLANRPFINVLRGRKEFIKYYHMMKVVAEGDSGDLFQNGDLFKPPENLFINYPFPVKEGRSLSLAIREFKETGFHEGIYDYAEKAEDQLIPILNDGQAIAPFFNGFRNKIRLFKTPRYPNDTIFP